VQSALYAWCKCIPCKILPLDTMANLLTEMITYYYNYIDNATKIIVMY